MGKSKYIGNNFTSKHSVNYTVLYKERNGYRILVHDNNKEYYVESSVVTKNTLLSIAMELGVYDKNPRQIGKYSTKSTAGKKWRDMKDRCYTASTIKLEQDATYSDCTVCDEWLILDNFGDWFYSQIGCDLGWELDKDILLEGNTVYCPEYCVLVPKEINLFLRHHQNKTNGLPTGVILDRGRFRSCCKVDGKYRGSTFSTVEEAEKDYLNLKYLAALKLKEKFTGIVPENILDCIINRYSKHTN